MSEQSVAAKAARQKWEHCTQAFASQERFETGLNEMGEQYWELVSVVAVEGKLKPIFKRPGNMFTSRVQQSDGYKNIAWPKSSR